MVEIDPILLIFCGQHTKYQMQMIILINVVDYVANNVFYTYPIRIRYFGVLTFQKHLWIFLALEIDQMLETLTILVIINLF